MDSPRDGLAACGLIFWLSKDSPISMLIRRNSLTKPIRRTPIYVAILLIAAVPACAQAQTRNTPKVTKGDAQKVATIIRSDKAKTQTYCEINKVSDQMNQAYGKNDKKTVDELSQKIDRLEKILGPDYVALMDALQKLGPENKKRVAEIMLQFAALDRLCAK